jgi:hypothetical protein
MPRPPDVSEFVTKACCAIVAYLARLDPRLPRGAAPLRLPYALAMMNQCDTAGPSSTRVKKSKKPLSGGPTLDLPAASGNDSLQYLLIERRLGYYLRFGPIPLKHLVG